eukprot:CAMPEP_0184540744 /NCGR_PEP_ID=MMETSP0199_2-20130426/902_1 /TAXON_ID=1112570 /ORGANISM="Thraustochytrium sp., Strain LLF1b" /LENGTH=444 /DNA_ID=CAMNT_0026934395 /DNA_START=49 /DNA_END=1383 /DNA_ORIENTATION=+
MEAALARLVELERRSRDQDDKILALQYEKGLDLLSEKREALTKERAEELLANAPKDAVAVRLGSKSFGEESSQVAAKVLEGLSKVVIADMSDIIAGRPEAEALEVLKVMCGVLPASTLKFIDLSENALGEKGIRALESVLTSFKSLEGIAFMNNGLSELSVDLLAGFLPTEHLKLLHFHNNMSGSGGAVAASNIVLKCSKLEDFRMSSSRVRSDGGLPLLKALSTRAPSLVRLNLSDSMLDEECTEELVGALKNMPKLTDLVLRDTGIEKGMLLEVLEDKDVVPRLSILDISGLELESEDADVVGKIVSSRMRLRKLWMDDNELESEGVAKFCLAATCRASPSKIEHISVQTNQVSQRGAVALAQFALAHPSVKLIELNDNQISTDAVEKIESMLAEKGREGVLGSLNDNAGSDDEDEDFDLEQVGKADDLDELTAALSSNLKI